MKRERLPGLLESGRLAAFFRRNRSRLQRCLWRHEKPRATCEGSNRSLRRRAEAFAGQRRAGGRGRTERGSSKAESCWGCQKFAVCLHLVFHIGNQRGRPRDRLSFSTSNFCENHLLVSNFSCLLSCYVAIGEKMKTPGDSGKFMWLIYIHIYNPPLYFPITFEWS